ncbi:MAG: hypothetical protein JNK15_21440 [Planctomycetes bacterium]|nr:hypothetical protein [Planctomycetota bacterium]
MPDPAVHPDPIGRPRERLFTPALVVFLLVVAGLVGRSLWRRFPTPDLAGGIALLADGDLDAAERERMLQRVLVQAKAAESVHDRWAGMLAAVALGDASAYAAMRARLGTGPLPQPLPPAAERTFLDLGDGVVRAAFAAWVAEAEGDRATARSSWQSVANQGRLSKRPFARDLGEAELARLR